MSYGKLQETLGAYNLKQNKPNNKRALYVLLQNKTFQKKTRFHTDSYDRKCLLIVSAPEKYNKEKRMHVL